MRVVVDDAVFASSAADPDLHRLFLTCRDGRHQLEVVPPPAPLCQEWLNTHAGRVSNQYQAVLDSSMRELATGQSLSVVRIPDLALTEALKLLGTPLRILVENERNDGAFLHAVLRGAREAEWQRALEGKWVGFEHGGGMQEIERRILSGVSSDPRRTYVIFDSDARQPGQPSTAAHRLDARCAEAKVSAHLLARRESENYLPLPALQLWLEESSRASKASLRPLLNQYRGLTESQRHHFNMRGGLKADKADAPLFCDLNDVARKALEAGFGDDVGRIFGRWERLPHQWLIEDGQGAEMEAVLDEILAML